MSGKPRNAVVLSLFLANAACATQTAEPVFDPDPVLHPPAGRINEANGRTIELRGPRVRIPERIWATDPPTFKALGLLETLNPAQEGGLFSTMGHAWKYRRCIEERRTAKRFLGPYAPSR